ncbi:hypothetical protein ACIBG0_21365 [Nocardia sp. NPDC050630]|uniref:hypothetical protein n=1 Tax=Nocardia sp. NPDC050630 TaxID=3364321 RepID=UPI0037A00B74
MPATVASALTVTMDSQPIRNSAHAVARNMVVPPHRAGGQARYLESPLPAYAGDSGLAATLQWALDHLAELLTVADLAKRANPSERTLARRFHAELGGTPLQWVLAQGLIGASEFLEGRDPPVDVGGFRLAI